MIYQENICKVSQQFVFVIVEYLAAKEAESSFRRWRRPKTELKESEAWTPNDWSESEFV